MRRRLQKLALELQGGLAARRLGTTMPPAALLPAVNRLLRGSETLLDVGCGPMVTLRELKVPVRVGVDAHRPYLEAAQSGIVPLHLDATSLASVILPKSFDAVTLIDVIEHFDVSDAQEVIRSVEQIARNVVVIFTPRGEFPQQDFDAYDLGGEEFQRHRSSWDLSDFETLGYRCSTLRGFHGPGNPSFVEAFGADAAPRDGILAWKRLT